MTTVTFQTPPTGSAAPPANIEQGTTERPAWLPENFKSAEDMARSYAELQSAYTKSQQELSATKGGKTEQPAPGEKPNTPPTAEIPAEGDDPAKKVADAAGVDLNPYAEEFSRTGDVTPESRGKIVESLKGILGADAEVIVNQYIDGQKVVGQNNHRMFMDAAGGEESYRTMVLWAKDNLAAHDKSIFNAQVNSGDRHAALFAIEGLKARYEAKNGRLPQRLIGQGGQVTPSSYRSSAEMVRDMSDPRYKSDPYYREEVQRKLASSNF